MAGIYSKSTKELFRDFVKSFTPPTPKGFGYIKRKPLEEGGEFTRKEILQWFGEHYPKIKKGTINAHLILMSTNAPSRIHYNLKPNGADDLLFQVDPKSFRLYNPESDPTPIALATTEKRDLDGEVDEPDEVQEFAYESDLRDFLAKNMKVIRPTMTLWQDGDINGVEFPVGGRSIDILAVENDRDLLVIELKVSKGYDRALVQLQRYMGWIKKNLAEPDQKVKGMIIARSITEDLRLAVSVANDIELFEYQLSISVSKVTT